MRALVLTGAAIVAALALGWTAGLEHQANCIHAGRTSCSVLPWDNGKARCLNAQGQPCDRLDKLARDYGLGP